MTMDLATPLCPAGHLLHTGGEWSWEMPRGLTLPLRGRVGAKLRGGVTLAKWVQVSRVVLQMWFTSTRRFAATSPLKGEVEARRRPPLSPLVGEMSRSDRGG